MLKRSLNLISLLLLWMAVVMCSCRKDHQEVTIAIPNDASNRTRALLLLQQLGYLRLKPEAELTVSLDDIDSNPTGIRFREIETQQLPAHLNEVDFAMIPSNVAMAAGLNPIQKAVAVGASSEYGNIVAVKEGKELSPEVKVIVAALRSRAVVDFIGKTYNGGVVSVVKRPGDGFDSTVDYQALEGRTIAVAASPAPHAEILQVVAELLQSRKIKLDIRVYDDDTGPNDAVENETVVANYFQYFQHLNEYNLSTGGHLVSCGEIHTEPMGLYPGHLKSLSLLNQ